MVVRRRRQFVSQHCYDRQFIFSFNFKCDGQNTAESAFSLFMHRFLLTRKRILIEFAFVIVRKFHWNFVQTKVKIQFHGKVVKSHVSSTQRSRFMAQFYFYRTCQKPLAQKPVQFIDLSAFAVGDKFVFDYKFFVCGLRIINQTRMLIDSFLFRP